MTHKYIVLLHIVECVDTWFIYHIQKILKIVLVKSRTTSYTLDYIPYEIHKNHEF